MANPDHLGMLRQKIDVWNDRKASLTWTTGSDADLECADLHYGHPPLAGRAGPAKSARFRATIGTALQLTGLSLNSRNFPGVGAGG